MEYVYRRPHWPYSRWYYLPLGAPTTAVNVLVPSSTYALVANIPMVTADPAVVSKRPQITTRYLFYPDIHRTFIHAYATRHIIAAATKDLGVRLELPSSTYIMNKHIPDVSIGPSGVNVIIPTVSSYVMVSNTPLIGISASVLMPLSQYVLTKLVSVVGTGILIDIPLSSYVLTALLPVVEVGVGVSLLIPESKYTLVSNLPTIHSTGIDPNTSELDLTPPFESTDQTRYLFHNFEILRDALAEGQTTQFTTTDGKTVLVRNGVIVDVYDT